LIGSFSQKQIYFAFLINKAEILSNIESEKKEEKSDFAV